MRDPLKVVTEGIERFNGKAFRIATLQKEHIIVTKADQVAEYIRAPDRVLDMLEAADDVGISSLLPDSIEGPLAKFQCSSNNRSSGRWAMVSPSAPTIQQSFATRSPGALERASLP